MRNKRSNRMSDCENQKKNILEVRQAYMKKNDKMNEIKIQIPVAKIYIQVEVCKQKFNIVYQLYVCFSYLFPHVVVSKSSQLQNTHCT